MNHRNDIRWSKERVNNYIDDEISKRKNQMEYYRILHHDTVVIDDIIKIRVEGCLIFILY